MSRRRPILLNLALIGAVLGLTPFLPNSGYAAAIGVAIAGLLQWLWLLIACSREGVGMHLVRPRWTARVSRLVRLATPVAIGGGVQQISTMLDVVWASLLPAGTISALYYADRIAQLPLGVVGIAIGTALLPLLARQLRAGQAGCRHGQPEPRHRVRPAVQPAGRPPRCGCSPSR